MRVFLSRLSLCSDTRICCLMISAEVIGRLGLTGGIVYDKGLAPPCPCFTGDVGIVNPPLPPLDIILLDGVLFNIFNPSALFTLLVGVVTTCPGFDPPSPFSWLE